MGEEMMISGIWINKQTGQKIQVMNNVMEGDQMYLITDMGMIDMNEFSRDYIQVSDEEYNEQGQVIGHSEVDMNTIIKPQPTIENLSNTNYNYNTPQIETNKSSNKVLEKFFNKVSNKENIITFDINFDELPINDLKTIIDYMDIDENEIAQYIAQNFLNKKYIEDAIVSKLNEKLK